MEELFGVPTERLMWTLLAVFGAGALLLTVSALRNRVSFRMAARNLPRRRAQTTLVVLGLMLATMLFSASFTTGDTLTNSLRVQALENLGQVDVRVQAGGSDDSGGGFGGAPAERARYFDASVAADVRDRLSGEDHVAGVAPLAAETVPVTAKGTDLSEPTVDVLGLDGGSMGGFDRLATASGATLAVGDLGDDEVYLSAAAAEGLDVGVGDEIRTTLAPAPDPGAATEAAALEEALNPEPSELEVAGIYERGANPASETSMVMPLERLQERVGKGGGSTPSSSPTRGPRSRVLRARRPPQRPWSRSSTRTTSRPSPSSGRP